MRALWILPFLVPAALGAQPTKRPTDEDRGRELYERHCVACHGTTAKGDGPATAALVNPVPDLSGAVKADKATIEIVQLGRNAMPAFEATFDNEDSRRVLAYMAKAEVPRPATPAEPAAGPVPDVAEDDAQQPAEGGAAP